MSQWGGLSGEAREMENSYLRAPRRHLPEKQPLQAASSVVHDAGCCYPDTRPGPRSPNGLLPTRVCRQLSTYTHLLDHPPIHPLPSADPLCAQTCSHTREAVFSGPSLLALGSSPQPLRS